MRLLPLALVGAVAIAPSSARAETDASFEVGVLSRGLGKADVTLGVLGSVVGFYGRTLRLSARGAILGTGFVALAPGGLLRGTLGLGFDIDWLQVDAGLGVDVLSYRACGPIYCGRMTGIVPAVNARLVVFSDVAQGALGAVVTGDMFYTVGSRIFEGVNVTVTAGPIVRFGRR